MKQEVRLLLSNVKVANLEEHSSEKNSALKYFRKFSLQMKTNEKEDSCSSSFCIEVKFLNSFNH